MQSLRDELREARVRGDLTLQEYLSELRGLHGDERTRSRSRSRSRSPSRRSLSRSASPSCVPRSNIDDDELLIDEDGDVFELSKRQRLLSDGSYASSSRSPSDQPTPERASRCQSTLASPVFSLADQHTPERASIPETMQHFEKGCAVRWDGRFEEFTVVRMGCSSDLLVNQSKVYLKYASAVRHF